MGLPIWTIAAAGGANDACFKSKEQKETPKGYLVCTEMIIFAAEFRFTNK